MESKGFLKKRRTELGLSQSDIAKAVGVSEGTISRWESGNIANMKRDRIYKLAQVLQIEPSALIFGEVNIQPASDAESERDESIFPDMLLSLRKRSGLSQQELADRLGSSKSLISMYESGARKPSSEMLEAIAGFFNVSVYSLSGQGEVQGQSAADQMTDEERRFVEMYNALSPERRRAIAEIMEAMLGK